MEDLKSTVGQNSMLRLGAWETTLKSSTKIKKAYGTDTISERHRHRYELNNDYREMLESAGLVISGTTTDGRLVDTIEYPKCDWFVACQYHPEFKSRPETPHPLFVGLVKTALKKK